MTFQVLLGKDYLRWNWDCIIELLQGPLLNPRRLEETLKNTKLIKRLLSFYRPYKNRYSEIKRTRGAYRFVRAGCALMKTLVCCPEGCKYLSENKFLAQFVECLSELDPVRLRSFAITDVQQMYPLSPTGPLFTKERFEETLCGEYFTIIGTLTKYKEGNE